MKYLIIISVLLLTGCGVTQGQIDMAIATCKDKDGVGLVQGSVWQSNKISIRCKGTKP